MLFMAPDRAEVSRRVKAARALGGFSKPAALAAHPLLKENGISASRVIQIEAQNRDAPPMELEAIARACGLPYEFFTADFASLAGESGGLPQELQEQLERMDHFIETWEDEALPVIGNLRKFLDEAQDAAGEAAEANHAESKSRQSQQGAS